VADHAFGPTPLPASNLQVADLAVGPPLQLPASNLLAADLAVGPPLQLPASYLFAAALHSIVRGSGFPYGSPAVVPCATTAIGDSPSRGNLGRRDNTRINAIPHETRLFRGPTDKDCGLFNEDTSVLGHWSQSRLGQSKDAA
jgi:hypothetical protein